MIWRYAIAIIAIAELIVSFVNSHLFALPVRDALRVQGVVLLMLFAALFITKEIWPLKVLSWAVLIVPVAFLYPYLADFNYFMWYDQVTMGVVGIIGIMTIIKGAA